MTENDHITSALLAVVIVIIICYRPSDSVKIDRQDNRTSLIYRTSDLTDFQNAVACKGYTVCSIENGIILTPGILLRPSKERMKE